MSLNEFGIGFLHPLDGSDCYEEFDFSSWELYGDWLFISSIRFSTSERFCNVASPNILSMIFALSRRLARPTMIA